jgi:antitoxin CcdA
MRIPCAQEASHEINAKHQSRKRPVNLTLNEELVSQAKGMTDNLSGVVEQLLTDFVMKQNSARQEKARSAEVAAQAWNSFNERSGSFADEHSTL